MYVVYDSLGNYQDKFPTMKQASWYKSVYGNKGWFIKKK